MLRRWVVSLICIALASGWLGDDIGVASESEEVHWVDGRDPQFAARTAELGNGARPEHLAFTFGGWQIPVGIVGSPLLDVGPDGTVYAADASPGYERVMRFAADGSLRGAWGSPGQRDGQFTQLRDLTVAHDETVFVADLERVQRFDPEGSFLGAWSWRERMLAGGVNEPSLRALDAGPWGGVCAIDSSNDRVWCFSAEGAPRGDWPSPRDERNTLWPEDLAVLPDASVVVAHTGSPPRGRQALGSLRRFASDGRLLWQKSFGEEGDLTEGYFLTQVDADPDGTIYLLQSETPHLWRFSPEGVLLPGWAPELPQAFEQLALAPDGSVYVGQLGLDPPIQHYDREGRRIGEIGRQRDWGSGDLLYGSSPVANSDGEIFTWLAWPGQSSILRYDRLGRPIGTWGSEGDGPGQFGICPEKGVMTCPNEIALHPDDGLVVSDEGHGRLQRFSKDGRFLLAFGDSGLPEARLEQPFEALAIDPAGRSYVIDRGGARIMRYDAAGRHDHSWLLPVGLRKFIDLAIGPQGTTVILAQRFDFDAQRMYELRVFHLTDQGMASSWPVSNRVHAIEMDGYERVLTFETVERASVTVQRHALDGTVIDEWRVEPGPDYAWPGFHLSQPTLDPRGRLLAVGNKGIDVYDLQAPESWRVAFHDNPWLTGMPQAIVEWKNLNPDYGMAAPAPNLPSDRFSLRAERTLATAGGQLLLHLRASGGARLWVDKRLLVDRWQASRLDLHTSLALPAGHHRVRVEYWDPGGAAQVSLEWQELSLQHRLSLPLALR